MTSDELPDWQGGLPFLLWRTQHAVHRRVQDALEGLGVTITQMGLVVHLDDLGNMSASDLARRFRLTPQSVTTALGLLERKGWVHRFPHPVHKKVIWYDLTPEGRAGVQEARTRMARLMTEFDELIGVDERRDLVDRLTALVEAVDSEPLPEGPLWPVAR